MEYLSPINFSDYELIDSGGFEKLERFGKHVIIRPEPQALWVRELPEREWRKEAHVRYVAKTSSSGVWDKIRDMPDRWTASYPLDGNTLSFRLALTRFKHVGLFPEQAVNWDFIYDSVKAIKASSPRVLNLFAYTGGASLAACAGGADVTHLDSVKQVVTWARENMERSGLDGIRWIIDDALAFVKRAQRRGVFYHGIILDPPAWGHGPDGQQCKLEDQLLEMTNTAFSLLDPEKHFFLLNTYSLGFSPLILENLMRQVAPASHFTCGEVFLPSSTGQKLPLGVFARSCKS